MAVLALDFIGGPTDLLSHLLRGHEPDGQGQINSVIRVHPRISPAYKRLGLKASQRW
jgi:hypothetical protein